PACYFTLGDKGDRRKRADNENISPRDVIGDVEDGSVVQWRAVHAHAYAEQRTQYPIVVRSDKTPTGQPKLTKRPLHRDQQRRHREEENRDEKRARHRRSVPANHT